MMHTVTKLRPRDILWPYKSQRKATNQEAGKHEKNGGERKKGGETQTEGDMEAEKPEE